MRAQASMSEADSEVIVTVAAMGAVTTRPLGWVALTVTCAGEQQSMLAK